MCKSSSCRETVLITLEAELHVTTRVATTMDAAAQASLWQPGGSMSYKGKPLSSAVTPCFVVEKTIVERNCQNMLDTCAKLGVKLRAQVKTHKTVEGAVLQTGGSRRGLVCSTLDECELLAANGFDDVLFGHPLCAHQVERVTKLTSHLSSFHVMVDSIEGLQVLINATPPQGKQWSLFFKVNCGNNRVGIWHEDVPLAVEMLQQLKSCSHTTFKGLYVHCGDTYAATNMDQVITIRDNNIQRLLEFTQQLEGSSGVRCATIGVGSTPSCSQPTQSMASLSELHPGNYAFYDVQQHLLGSCGLEDIAVSVATRVIGHYPRRNQMLIDCGFTGLTKQGWGTMKTGYGIFKDNPHLKLSAMNQEHGFVEPVDCHERLDYSRYPVGCMLFILPYHSCATANLYGRYLVVEDGVVVEEWKPTRGW